MSKKDDDSSAPGIISFMNGLQDPEFVRKNLTQEVILRVSILWLYCTPLKTQSADCENNLLDLEDPDTEYLESHTKLTLFNGSSDDLVIASFKEWQFPYHWTDLWWRR
jgi:hypothetical protein